MYYKDRSFGVEIECKSAGQGQFGTSKLLRDNGFARWADRIGWDGSEIEIRSPILQGSAGLRELKGVMNLLASNGYTTKEADGMHCHFDARDLNETDIKRLIFSWDNNKDVVAEFLGERFDNGHCTYDYDFEALESGNGYMSSVYNYDGEKCYAIEPRSRLRTVEFRQHYGTLNFDDARAWILFVQAFIKNVKERKGVIKRASMEELFSMTRTYKIAQRNLVERKGRLSYDYDGSMVWS